MNPVRLGTLS